MNVLVWNLNHRAAQRRIPAWIAPAIHRSLPDVAILTEYVEGPDHQHFLKQLAALGLPFASVSKATRGENQILIASKLPQERGHLVAPSLHSSVPPNALHVRLPQSGTNCLGFRLPAFSGTDQQFRRPTWEWLLSAAEELKGVPSVIGGDFNTALGDSDAKCGDCLRRLSTMGWQHVQPSSGCSFRHSSGSERLIDHLFASPAFIEADADYSWEFQALDAEAASGKVGIPDHAMLIASLTPQTGTNNAATDGARE